MYLNKTNILLKFNQYAKTFPKLEIQTKRISDMNLLSAFVNRNFQVKRSSQIKFLPEKDSYSLRLILNQIQQAELNHKNILESFIYNNSLKNADVITENFQDNKEEKLVNTLFPEKSQVFLIDLNLRRNIFRKESYEYSRNSNDFNDICGNYIKFVIIFLNLSLKNIYKKLT